MTDIEAAAQARKAIKQLWRDVGAFFESLDELRADEPEPEPIEVGQVWCQWGGVGLDGNGWWIGDVVETNPNGASALLQHVADCTYHRVVEASDLRTNWRRIPYRREGTV